MPLYLWDGALVSLLENYSVFLIDLDGVVYLNDRPVPGGKETIKEIQRRGLGFLFLSNNSSATPQQYVEKLLKMGIQVEVRNVMTSGQALGRYIEENYPAKGKTGFVIGEYGLESELEARGIKLLQGDAAKEVDFVVVGWDRFVTYEKLKIACVAIRNGATYLATNKDATFPTPHELWPGAGAIVAAVTTASGREPVAIGKPNPYMVKLGLERLGASEKDALIVGDRLETDILAGIEAGVDSALVLSGISREEDIVASGIIPTHVIESLSSLL